jgi:hypothetical protein
MLRALLSSTRQTVPAHALARGHDVAGDVAAGVRRDGPSLRIRSRCAFEGLPLYARVSAGWYAGSDKSSPD